MGHSATHPHLLHWRSCTGTPTWRCWWSVRVRACRGAALQGAPATARQPPIPQQAAPAAWPAAAARRAWQQMRRRRKQAAQQARRAQRAAASARCARWCLPRPPACASTWTPPAPARASRRPATRTSPLLWRTSTTPLPPWCVGLLFLFSAPSFSLASGPGAAPDDCDAWVRAGHVCSLGSGRREGGREKGPYSSICNLAFTGWTSLGDRFHAPLTPRWH